MAQSDQFLKKAKSVVYMGTGIEADDLYIVWFAKTLQNWKALVSTDVVDGEYYEVTYNGDKKETYFDRYIKAENVVVRDVNPS